MYEVYDVAIYYARVNISLANKHLASIPTTLESVGTSQGLQLALNALREKFNRDVMSVVPAHNRADGHFLVVTRPLDNHMSDSWKDPLWPPGRTVGNKLDSPGDPKLTEDDVYYLPNMSSESPFGI